MCAFLESLLLQTCVQAQLSCTDYMVEELPTTLAPSDRIGHTEEGFNNVI